jgi:cardiolipin synthase
LNLPNYLTFFRILLCPFFFTVLVSFEAGEDHLRLWALGIFLVAAATDALDGLLARIMRKRTRLGEFLDPLADKMLLLSGYLGLLYVEALRIRPPLWVTVTIFFRDAVIMGGTLIVFLLSGDLHIQTNLLGKLTTAFQMITLVAVLLEWQAALWLCYVTAGLTVASGVVYVAREVRRLSNLES